MSEQRGVFAVSRSIWDDPDFAPQEFTEREAFMWLVGAAAWNDRSVRGSAGPVALARGEFCFSVRFLGDKWKWSKSRVDRFLDRLENRDIIRASDRDSAKVYSIKNYNRYQVVGLPERDSERDTDRDASGTAAGQQRDKEETLKHSNKDSLPVKEAFDAYNAKATELKLPTAKILSSDRRRKLEARLREHQIVGWMQALEELTQAPFLLGQNDRGWRADLDFLLSPAKLNRLIEGGYRTTEPQSKNLPPGVRANGIGYYLTPGSEPFERWKRDAERRNDMDAYWKFKAAERVGNEVHVTSIWPRSGT